MENATEKILNRAGGCPPVLKDLRKKLENNNITQVNFQTEIAYFDLTHNFESFKHRPLPTVPSVLRAIEENEYEKIPNPLIQKWDSYAAQKRMINSDNLYSLQRLKKMIRIFEKIGDLDAMQKCVILLGELSRYDPPFCKASDKEVKK